MRVLTGLRTAAATGRIAAVLAVASSAMEGNGEAFELWNELKVSELNKADWRTYTWLEARYREGSSHPAVWLAQQNLYRRFSERWEMGIGGTYLEARNAQGGWNSQTRIQLEINPRWNLGQEFSISLRNRMEWRFFERPGDSSRLVSRHRLLLSKQVSWFGGRQRIEFSEELFFDTRLGLAIENRLRPVNLHFRAGGRWSVNVFTQLRSRRIDGTQPWKHSAALGLGLRRN